MMGGRKIIYRGKKMIGIFLKNFSEKIFIHKEMKEN